MIIVKLFASLKERAGTDEVRLSLANGTVADVLELLAKDVPALADMLGHRSVIIALNQDFAAHDARVKDGDEVALMPPFSGGADGRIRIQQEPFSVDQEIEQLKRISSSIGAIVTFLGTTRDLSKRRRVAKLEFEHYPGMAEKKLAEIRLEAIRRFGVIDILIVHRVGLVPISENIVLIAVASGHREEAFAACSFCIDELKRITPIWKKETTPEGDYWVEEHP